MRAEINCGGANKLSTKKTQFEIGAFTGVILVLDIVIVLMNLSAENRVLQSHYFSRLKGNAGNLRGHLRARRYFRRGIEQTRARTAAKI